MSQFTQKISPRSCSVTCKCGWCSIVIRSQSVHDKSGGSGSENEIKTDIYLLIGELIRVMNFLNTEFEFSASECLVVPARN